MAKPEKSFRLGPVHASVFLNDSQSGPFHTIQVQRRYKDEQSGEWRSSANESSIIEVNGTISASVGITCLRIGQSGSSGSIKAAKYGVMSTRNRLLARNAFFSLSDRLTIWPNSSTESITTD